MSSRKIIFFELNEVPYKIFDHYCKQHPQSSLAKLFARSQQYETFAADQGELAPTRTWPTLHRGVDDVQHGLKNFGQPLDEVDAAYPPIWQALAQRGIKVGVFGSLFSFPMPKQLDNYAFYMPDAFATDKDAWPLSWESFQAFNLLMSRASSRNVSSDINMGAAKDFLLKSPSLGVKPQTFAAIGKQLAQERVQKHVKTRRRSYQTVLSFDLFMQQLQEKRPDFTTFFTNHVAAAMHRYWAATFPGDYQEFGLEDEWVKTYAHEIEYAMGQSDKLVKRLMQFVDRDPEYVLVVVTSMGQAADRAEHVTSCVGITDLPKFMQRLGVEPHEYEERPAMAPIFNVVVQPQKREAVRQAIRTLEIGNELIGGEVEDGFFEFAFGPLQNYRGTEVAFLGSDKFTFAEMGLDNVPHEDGVYLTGSHIPQGALLVYDPRQTRPASAQRQQISTLEIAPSLLKHFEITPPSYMQRSVDLIPA
jgi:hypothetical protein